MNEPDREASGKVVNAVKIALHTRLRADGVEGYQDAHDHIPPVIRDLLRAGGASSWTIWRNGVDLFHLVECEDWDALQAFMARHEEDQAWQEQVGRFRDFSLAGGDRPMSLVFEL